MLNITKTVLQYANLQKIKAKESPSTTSLYQNQNSRETNDDLNYLSLRRDIGSLCVFYRMHNEENSGNSSNECHYHVFTIALPTKGVVVKPVTHP